MKTKKDWQISRPTFPASHSSCCLPRSIRETGIYNSWSARVCGQYVGAEMSEGRWWFASHERDPVSVLVTRVSIYTLPAFSGTRLWIPSLCFPTSQISKPLCLWESSHLDIKTVPKTFHISHPALPGRAHSRAVLRMGEFPKFIP